MTDAAATVSCVTCPFQDMLPTETGGVLICRRYPPAVLGTGEPMHDHGSGDHMGVGQVWPPADASDWCGEHPALRGLRE